MTERMTWKEIQERYPDQWVGLVDVEWKNQSNIISAIVKYTDKEVDKNDLVRMQIRGEIFSCYTTPDNAFQLGMIGA